MSMRGLGFRAIYQRLKVLTPLQPLRSIRQALVEARISNDCVKFINRLTDDLNGKLDPKGEVGLLVLPWLPFTMLSEFTVALGLAFRMRGRRVSFIWDDTPFGAVGGSERRQQLRIGRLLRRMPATLSTLRLSDFTAVSIPALPEEEIELLAELNSFRHFFTETLPPVAAAHGALLKRTMTVTAGRIQTLLQEHPFDYLVVPGGIYRTSGIFVRLGKRLGVRVASFDSGTAEFLISTDGVASYLDDIPRALACLPDDDESVVEQARAEFRRRREGKDTFSSQVVAAAGEAIGGGVLIPLNQSFDTSSLGRHRVFSSQTEWMMESVAWVLDHTDEPLVVRRHPVERLTGMHSLDDYEGLLARRFGDSPRIRFVRAEDPVSTYDLLAGATVVLPHTSTVGVEAAALGKPVVTQSNSYYAGLGFVWAAESREEYFQLLGRAIAGDLRVNEGQRRAAWRCYYLAQCCNFLQTPFIPANILSWVNQGPHEVLGGKDLDLVFESFEADQPLALGVHLRAEAARQAAWRAQLSSAR